MALLAIGVFYYQDRQKVCIQVEKNVPTSLRLESTRNSYFFILADSNKFDFCIDRYKNLNKFVFKLRLLIRKAQLFN